MQLLAEANANDWIPTITLALTTLGGMFALWIGLRQKAIEAKLEIARLEAEKVAKQGRRTSRRVRQVIQKTDEQTAIIQDTKIHVEKVEKNTNGMQAQLLQATAEQAKREGHEEGKAAAKEAIKEVVKEVAKEIIPQLPQAPQQVTVMNNADQPMPVEIKEHR